MTRIYITEFSNFTKKEKIGVSLIVIIISLSFILIPIYMFFRFPKADKSAEFIFEYDGADVDFGTIDYSGIECKIKLEFYQVYFIDGVNYFTDASGIIHFVFNDKEDHIFSCLFGGILYEYTFNASIQQYVMLATKEIASIVYYDEVLVAADDVLVDLYWYDGSEWILIETASTDSEGLVSFTGLIMGSYIICESGLFVEENSFELTQDIATYTGDVFIPPKVTIIDIDYLNTIFGADFPLDLSDIIFSLWYNTQEFNPSVHCDGIIYNDAEGRIIIYNLYEVAGLWTIKITYAGEMTSYTIDYHTLTEIDLIAKSGEFSFEWSSDSSPVQGMDFELFYFDGVDWISAGVFTTDVDGKIIITEMLPCGTYKFEDYPEFTIVGSDVIITRSYSVESIVKIISISISGKREVLTNINRDILVIFFFNAYQERINYKVSIMLILKLHYRAVGIFGFSSFEFRLSFYLYSSPTALFNLL